MRDKHREVEVQHVSRERIIRELEVRFLKEVATGISKRIKEIIDFQQIQHKSVFLQLYFFVCKIYELFLI